jgi:hypothetical protein
MSGVITRKQRWADLAERALWTLVQSGIAVGAVDLLIDQLPGQAWYAPVVAMVASLIKGWLAQRIGQTATAATLPGDLDPANGKHAAPDVQQSAVNPRAT